MPKRTDALTRFMSKVQQGEPDECWLWLAGTNANGYGRFSVNSRHVLAHRWIYEELVAPIPTGLQIDHLCRVKRCVNPRHMEPVTARVNTLRSEGVTAQRARQTRCAKGHEFTPENTFVKKPTKARPNPSRQCRTCMADAAHQRYLRTRTVAA